MTTTTTSNAPIPMAERLARLRDFSRRVRVSEYHVTNACNLRCKGCWFFEYDFDTSTKELASAAEWRAFAQREKRERGITAALLIGGEPTLFPDRIAAFVETMDFVTVSTNGQVALPREGFENVAIGVTVFGGGAHDDELRGWHPSGRPLTGLLDTALSHYKNDERIFVVYAVATHAVDAIEDTVRRVRDNGNKLSFNFYRPYEAGRDVVHIGGAAAPDTAKRDAEARDAEQRLLDELLRVRDRYRDTVVNDPLYLRTLVTGKTSFGSFGYDTCPSISVDHPAHAERLKAGARALPGFNAYAADGKTVNFCCTSGHCDDCRDSQAVYSWLLMSRDKFMASPAETSAWLDLAEGYWAQFCWAPYRSAAPHTAASSMPASRST